MKNLIFNKYVLCVVGMLFMQSALASNSERLSLNELVSQSSTCVLATATNTEYGEENGSVVTYTTFKVKKAAFGNPGDEVTVKTFGGERKLGRLLTSEVVAGSPQFLTKQDVLLFLSQSSNSDKYLVTGFSQGAMNVQQSSNGAVVQLFPTGPTDIDEALDVIEEQRNSQ